MHVQVPIEIGLRLGEFGMLFAGSTQLVPPVPTLPANWMSEVPNYIVANLQT